MPVSIFFSLLATFRSSVITSNPAFFAISHMVSEDGGLLPKSIHLLISLLSVPAIKSWSLPKSILYDCSKIRLLIASYIFIAKPEATALALFPSMNIFELSTYTNSAILISFGDTNIAVCSANAKHSGASSRASGGHRPRTDATGYEVYRTLLENPVKNQPIKPEMIMTVKPNTLYQNRILRPLSVKTCLGGKLVFHSDPKSSTCDNLCRETSFDTSLMTIIMEAARTSRIPIGMKATFTSISYYS